MKRVLLTDIIDPAFFRAFGDPTRVSVVAELMRMGGEANVSSIADGMSVDLSVVSRHLKELVQVGALEVERRGRERWYRLRYDVLISHFAEITRQLRALRDGKACC